MTTLNEPQELWRSQATTIVVIFLTLVTIFSSCLSYAEAVRLQTVTSSLDGRIKALESTASITSQVATLRNELREEHDQRMQAQKEKQQ